MREPTTRLPDGSNPIRWLLESIRDRALEAVVRLVHAEIDQAVGVESHERGEARRGYRNGSKTRTVVVPGGSGTVQVPRAQIQGEDGQMHEFESQVLPRYARRSPVIDEVILRSYLGGQSARKVGKTLEPILGAATLSRSSISRVVRKLRDHFTQWMQRDLSQERYVVLYMDAMMLPVRMVKRVVKVPAQVVIGVRDGGEKVLLSLRIAPSESTATWKGVVEDLERRGLPTPKLVITDGNRGLLRAIAETWPQADLQRCAKHKLENLKAAAPRHCHAELKRDYHAIIYAEDFAAGLAAYDGFCRKWRKLCEGVVTSLQEAGHDLLTFYRYPRRQWRSLRTTNPIERLNGEFRRRTKTQSSFSNESAALVLLWGLIAYGYVRLRKIDGWKDMPKVVEMLNEAA